MKIAAAASHATATLLSAASLSAAAVAEAPAISSPLRVRTKSVGFQILTGNTQGILGSLRAGANGAAPAFAACAAQTCYEVLAAWKDADSPLAEETIGNLKFACDLNGYFGGLPRLPLLPPTGDQRSALEQSMQHLRN
jgi:dihydrodipicolinate synthase/N-acetylneuraminate lyase